MSAVSVSAFRAADGTESVVSSPSNSVRSSSLRPSTEYSTAAKLWRPRAAEARRVSLTDSAESVVTDFTREPPITVTEDLPIDDALRDMISAEIRALVVVRGDMVSGLITSYDIQGERPLQFLRTSTYTRHDEIEVRHVMTPWYRVPKVDWRSVRAARVDDVAMAFESTRGATHLMIVERVGSGDAFVRGLISRTRLERQLGHPV